LEILLIPGFMLDSDLWTDIRNGLNEFGRLVDVDITLDTSIEAIVERAVSALHDRAIAIGFSMGGYVARAITYRAPEKIAALAQIATSSRDDITSLSSARAAAANPGQSLEGLSC